MSDSLEIERKFLVKRLPPLDGARGVHLRQGYLSVGVTEVRLREVGEAYCLTCKRGAGRTRTEVEVEITADQFNALWGLTEGARVEKPDIISSSTSNWSSSMYTMVD